MTLTCLSSVNRLTWRVAFVWQTKYVRDKLNKCLFFYFFLFFTCCCSCVLRFSSSSTLLQQLWQIQRGTSPSRDWDREGTASASLRPGTSRKSAWESAGTASASFVPWTPGSPLTEPAPQSLNSRWHRRQQVCIGFVKTESVEENAIRHAYGI